MKIRCVVSCVTADGTPSFFPCEVEVTQEEYNNGSHYDMAKDMAFEADFEQCGVVYDENDGPTFLFAHLFQ